MCMDLYTHTHTHTHIHTHLDNDHFVPFVVVVSCSDCEEDEHHNQEDRKHRGTNNDSFHVLRETCLRTEHIKGRRGCMHNTKLSRLFVVSQY